MKIFTGKVVSKKQTKTATVAVETVKFHPVYKKRVKTVKKYHVHDENDETKVGQVVNFAASRPFSKLKKWSIVRPSEKKVAKKKGTVKK